MAIPALGDDGGGVEGAGFAVAGGVVGVDVVVAAEQSNDVVGGGVVQPHARFVLVRTAYELGLSAHTHQPGPLAMAADVLRGSAAWKHDTVVAAVVEGEAISVDEAWAAATPAETPPMIPPIAAASVGDIPAAVPPNRPPSPAMIAAAIEAGKASVPDGKSI